MNELDELWKKADAREIEESRLVMHQHKDKHGVCIIPPEQDDAATKPIEVALVSAEDYEKVRHLRWSRSGQRYAHAHSRGRLVRLHQLVLETDLEVDHENGNRLDCRRWNLRETSRAQNGQNLGVRRDSESSSRNVRYRADRGYYVVRVYRDGICHWGGHHDTQEEAEAAARKLRSKLFTHNNEGRYA